MVSLMERETEMIWEMVESEKSVIQLVKISGQKLEDIKRKVSVTR